MKTVLVTGATDGIGRETARQLLAQGWHVFVHGRSAEKAERAAHELRERVPCDDGLRSCGRAAPVWGDLARMAQVVGLARQVKSTTDALDALINNAGVFEPVRRTTPDGFEMTMAVNHFAPFVLTRHLLEALRKSPSGRIITVSSIAHGSGTLDLDDLSFAAHYDGYSAYAASKLANILFTAALARRLAATAVTANSLHPGVITTKLLWAGFRMKGRTVEDGARTSVHLATSDAVARASGKYFVDCAEAQPAAPARDEPLAEALWTATERAAARFL